MMIKRLLKEPRIIIALIFVVIAIAAIRPVPVQGEEGTMAIKTNIMKGLDLQGGVRALILPKEATKEMVDKSITVLTTRISAFGLKEMKLAPVKIGEQWYLQLELAGSTEEELRNLIEKQGKFEANINRYVDVSENEGAFKLDGKSYDVNVVSGGNIEIGEITAKINDSFVLEDISFTYTNYTNDTITLSALVFKGEDITQVFTDAQHSRILQVGTGQWTFNFVILASKESAERFAKVTKDVEIEATGIEKSYLKTNIDLYLDNALIDSLRIDSGLRGEVATQPRISGPGVSKEDALSKMRNLQSILQSGALPTEIEIVKINQVSPTLGAQFMKLAVVAILFSIFAVSIVIFIRYKDPRVVIPIIITSCTEVLLIFGFAALVHWTIDLAAIAGIVAAIGSGVDHQIIIVDESDVKKKDMSLKRKMQSAFFIIFSSAATTISAMAMIFIFLKGGGLYGFAFTTIIGVLIGVLITRPCFAKIIEYLRQ